MKATKAIVKTILEISSNQKDVPTTKDNTIDMEKFAETPCTKAVITFFGILGVDYKWLVDNGFIAAAILYGQFLK